MIQNNFNGPMAVKKGEGDKGAPVFLSARFGEYRSLAQRTMKKSKKMSKK